MRILGVEMYSVLSFAECVKIAHLLFFFLSVLYLYQLSTFSWTQMQVFRKYGRTHCWKLSVVDVLGIVTLEVQVPVQSFHQKNIRVRLAIIRLGNI